MTDTVLSQVIGWVRGRSRTDWGEGQDARAAINNGGDLSVCQGLPPMTESVRLGDTWMCSIATGSAFTHVAAWPTTRAELVLYNGQPSNGKSLVIESAWAANVATSIAAASAYTLLGQVVPTGTAPSDDTAQLIVSQSGKGTAYGGLTRRAVANTAFGVASKWQVLNSIVTPAASIGSGVFADIKGGIVIPPGGLFLLNLVTGTATGTASIGVVWSERQLNLG